WAARIRFQSTMAIVILPIKESPDPPSGVTNPGGAGAGEWRQELPGGRGATGAPNRGIAWDRHDPTCVPTDEGTRPNMVVIAPLATRAVGVRGDARLGLGGGQPPEPYDPVRAARRGRAAVRREG